MARVSKSVKKEEDTGSMNAASGTRSGVSAAKEISPSPPLPISPSAANDEFAAPPDADLSYIADGLRNLAVRCDSLLLDPMNVKDHGDDDLPSHAASLREFKICRAVVARRADRQVEAGNGTLLAAIKNGWQYVPVLFTDHDKKTARAFALADNAIGTLAHWNEENLQKLAAEADLFESPDLTGLAEQIELQLGTLVDDDKEGEEEIPVTVANADGITLSRRVIAICDTEEKQIELLKELTDRGHECRLSTVRIA